MLKQKEKYSHLAGTKLVSKVSVQDFYRQLFDFHRFQDN